MNERKILDFEMEKGKNISAFYVNAETDDPTRLNHTKSGHPQERN